MTFTIPLFILSYQGLIVLRWHLQFHSLFYPIISRSDCIPHLYIVFCVELQWIISGKINNNTKISTVAPSGNYIQQIITHLMFCYTMLKPYFTCPHLNGIQYKMCILLVAVKMSCSSCPIKYSYATQCILAKISSRSSHFVIHSPEIAHIRIVFVILTIL